MALSRAASPSPTASSRDVFCPQHCSPSSSASRSVRQKKTCQTASTFVSTFGVSSHARKPSRNSSLSCCLLTTAPFGSHSFRPSTKIQVYRAVVVPTLLYGAETWVLYRKQIRLLERFHQRCLRSILCIKWQDHVSNEEVLKRASLPSTESILFQARLRWSGRVSRMEDIRMPKQSSSASSKKESAIVVLQESVTKTS